MALTEAQQETLLEEAVKAGKEAMGKLRRKITVAEIQDALRQRMATVFPGERSDLREVIEVQGFFDGASEAAPTQALKSWYGTEARRLEGQVCRLRLQGAPRQAYTIPMASAPREGPPDARSLEGKLRVWRNIHGLHGLWGHMMRYIVGDEKMGVTEEGAEPPATISFEEAKKQMEKEHEKRVADMKKEAGDAQKKVEGKKNESGEKEQPKKEDTKGPRKESEKAA